MFVTKPQNVNSLAVPKHGVSTVVSMLQNDRKTMPGGQARSSSSLRMRWFQQGAPFNGRSPGWGEAILTLGTRKLKEKAEHAISEA